MGIMMLNPQKRQIPRLGELLCHSSGIVAGMQVAGDERRLHLQQGLHALHRFPQGITGAEVREVPHVAARVEKIAYAEAEGIFQLTADGQHLPLRSGGRSAGIVLRSSRRHEIRQGRIAPGAPQHKGLAPEILQDGIVRPHADVPVVAENQVRNAAELLRRTLIVPADRSPGMVSAGHDEDIRKVIRAQRKLGLRGARMTIVKKQALHRRIGQHDAEIGIVRCNRRRNTGIVPLPEQQNGLLVSRQRLSFLTVNPANVFGRRQIPRHHGKRLRRSVLPFPEPSNRFLRCGITAEMEATDALHRHDTALPDHPPGLPQGFLAPDFRLSQKIQLRAAVGTADGLGVIAPVRRILVLPRAVRAHGKVLHGCALPIIGKAVQNAEPGTAAGAVDEGMEIAAVLRIHQLCLTLRAHGNVRRYKDFSRGFRALHNAEVRKMQLLLFF